MSETNFTGPISENAEQDADQERLLDPAQMTYSDFAQEYETVMAAVAEKEKKGGLDLDDRASYREMTDDEHTLMTQDWKEFSRSRGFSEDDIIEYERWLEISGQTDELQGAINDPWRRRKDHPGSWSREIYLKHVDHALQNDLEISPEVEASYNVERAVLDQIRGEYTSSPGIAAGSVVVGMEAERQRVAGTHSDVEDDVW
jgi:hypothetical protein